MYDEKKYLIVINGDDKSTDIAYLKETESSINIRFKSSDKIYTYRDHSKISIYKNPTTIDMSYCRIYLQERCLNNIAKALDFKMYVKVFYVNGKISMYKKSILRFEFNALQKANNKNIFNYIKTLAKSIKSDDNDFLDKQYEKITYLSENSVFVKYLSQDVIEQHHYAKVKIFPFGLNLSQEVAVTKALTHQVSIIEGPPGTGKTQTILNIIANLLLENKTIAVVSNNNAAIQNVYDKLDEYNLSFFVAMLGKKANQEAFFDNQKEEYSTVFNAVLDDTLNNRKTLEKDIIHIKEMLQTYNDLAKASQEFEALKIEKKYFMQIYETRDVAINKYEEILSKQSWGTLLSFLAEIESLQSRNKQMTLFFRIKALFKYKIFAFGLYKYPTNEIILVVQKCFYDVKEKEFESTIFNYKQRLENENFEMLLDQYKTNSMDLLELHLSKKYDLKQKRQQFEKDILWKDFDTFTKEYPVVLSTTHALRNCTKENFLYDYLIIDEASQVDIVAGGLALSCAKNVVIVGDQKQLPHIVTKGIKLVADSVFNKYTINPYYHYKNSLLASSSIVFNGVPKTLLKEHYRCNPKIIDFCNKKFYNDELIILSKDEQKAEPLILINTAEGNHARGLSNQRQVDVIKNEVLPYVNRDNLGIISPFRDQVRKLSDSMSEDFDIEIDTVHKYQGREKDVIIITTVVDKENEFADDPKLLNVAISRAKEQLYIVVSDREKNQNMKDLVNYIRYNNFDIVESKVYSIFDLLYKSYAPYLKKYLIKTKNISEYQSENLMNVIIDDVLNLEQYTHLGYIQNYSLKKLIHDTSILNKDELTFVNASSHIDFLIYNKIYKKEVLAIEVDGVAYHANNPSQLKRDALKDKILGKYSIPIIRFSTDGSEEEKRLLQKLEDIEV